MQNEPNLPIYSSTSYEKTNPIIEPPEWKDKNMQNEANLNRRATKKPKNTQSNPPNEPKMIYAVA